MAILASDWANITPYGGGAPVTLASAATVAPTTFLTVLTGNTAIATITPPVSTPHLLGFLFAGTAGLAATGNIATAKASVVGEIMLVYYNTATGKYSPVG